MGCGFFNPGVKGAYGGGDWRILKDDTTLRNSNIKSGVKITMIGSLPSEVQTIRDADAKISHQPFNRQKSKYAINPYKDVKSSSPIQTQYKFHQIQVLEDFPSPEKARELLERLSEDRGIRGIMEKHKFSVGILAELSPTRKEILGYNENKGQAITLRLRTDDLEGFRDYQTIRRVLLHELAHCVWTEHDDNFHRLNRQLNKEVVELDWTKSTGRQISHHEYYHPPHEEDNIDAAGYVGGTFRLGGDTERTKKLSRREILAEAATLRLTKEEKELDKGCGLDNKTKQVSIDKPTRYSLCFTKAKEERELEGFLPNHSEHHLRLEWVLHHRSDGFCIMRPCEKTCDGLLPVGLKGGKTETNYKTDISFIEHKGFPKRWGIFLYIANVLLPEELNGGISLRFEGIDVCLWILFSNTDLVIQMMIQSGEEETLRQNSLP
ncbi:3630_t:CDS:2, partial [Ambispora leptoticha]